MAWTATITSVRDTPVPSFDKVVDVHFAHPDGREIRRSYNLVVTVYGTADAIRAFAEGEAARLDAADQAQAEIMAGSN